MAVDLGMLATYVSAFNTKYAKNFKNAALKEEQFKEQIIEIFKEIDKGLSFLYGQKATDRQFFDAFYREAKARVTFSFEESTTLQDAADILHENEEIEYNAYNAGTLAGMISITQVEDTYLLNVSATASNRIVARDVANAVADASVNLAGEDGDLGFGQIAVIRRADVPSVENGTGISIKVALATLVGLALAIGIVFLLYVTDDRIKTQEDILRSYNVPVLGVIPPESVQ